MFSLYFTHNDTLISAMARYFEFSLGLVNTALKHMCVSHSSLSGVPPCSGVTRSEWPSP